MGQEICETLYACSRIWQKGLNTVRFWELVSLHRSYGGTQTPQFQAALEITRSGILNQQSQPSDLQR